MPFSVFMERALYDAERGFYETGGRAGRRGDFVTSPEVGPLFGASLARALDQWWIDLGRPDPFLVDEHGAGPGTLARTVLVAEPACGPALRWTLVERSAAQRQLHPDHLPHVGHLDPEGTSTDRRWVSPDAGPLVASAAGRPDRPAHVILANELLDNLPFDLLERTAAGWGQVRVVAVGSDEEGPGRSSKSSPPTAASPTPHGVPSSSFVPGAGHETSATPSSPDPRPAPTGRGPGARDEDRPEARNGFAPEDTQEPANPGPGGGRPVRPEGGRGARTRPAEDGPAPGDPWAVVEVRADADPADATRAGVLAPGAVEGSRIPLQHEAGEWVADSLAQLAPGGRLLVVDYATTTADLAGRPPSEWIRTYAGHARGGAPLDAPGAQDITVEVCTDQLAGAARPPDQDRSQASALRAWGLEDLVEEGRRLWAESAAAPDLAALRARSRIAEAETLTDATGLGAFRVLEWRVSAPYSGQSI